MKFIDLFAGIGGFRIALESIGAQCVFSAEINPHACDMYKKNFGDHPYGDVTQIDPFIIPDFDILCAGFPCQAFSISGKKKGFAEARGTLFFDICRIIEAKKPLIVFLENVKNLEIHDHGNTFSTMKECLNSLGYTVSYKVLNACDFGVPQNRERIIIVASKNGISFDFSKVVTQPTTQMLSFLDDQNHIDPSLYLSPHQYKLLDEQHIKVQKSNLIFIGFLQKPLRKVGVKEGTEHLSRVHKQPNRIYSARGVHPTLSSQEVSGRYWIYHNELVRKLTISECYRFMGFPEDFKKIGSTSQLYARIGNSVCVPMIKAIAFSLKNQFFLK